MTGVHHSFVARNRLWRRLGEAVAAWPEPLSTPTFVVDLDAFDANAADLVRRAGGKPVRVASKSLRVPALVSRALATPGFAGVLAYTVAEALWLVENDVSDDVVVAYPSVDRAALGALVASPRAASRITIMVDDVAHLDAVDALRASTAVPVRVAIDVDAGLRWGGQQVGPRRSPLFDVGSVAALARTVVERPGFQLVGVMTYEGQVAGVPDQVPHQRARSAVVRKIKELSVQQLEHRRAAIAEAVDALVGQGGFTGLQLWNAGGSGSLETSAADPVVTEVTAGSGLLGPTLFDHYRSFSPRPAAFFGLPVTRRPAADVATVHGGGLVASGPTGADRAPTPWAPAGLRLTGLEGAGEVQTPLLGTNAATLEIGDLVWFRHAKSGEPFEHGTTVLLADGDRFVEEVPTYRGHGLAF
ncbi:D-serine deaminase-like pyridoxal phosphate-dependent protein [Nocardioides sp. J9]|uniref:amino acid deaminase/aldolase n=1 Tax=unclassified Nocardioides TaxID=2615069 RepID=UPI00048A95BE|nr:MULTISPECIES: amino acid deaminase/aldolase [unclassified Nocardioides]TWH00069.1 D-serine deaminase-like pyridoxal phosphate-dependent protein [Nocardioides sp. J9]